MSGIRIEEALITLNALKSQLDKRGVMSVVEYEEISITKTAIRLRRDGKTLKIPLVEVIVSPV